MENEVSTPEIKDLSEIAKIFITEQHKQRRQEIENYLNRIESDQKNGLLLTGAIWSWLAINLEILKTLRQFEIVTVLIPFTLMLFFSWRCSVMHKTISSNAEHLRNLEDKVGLGLLGWEQWLKKERDDKPSTASLKTNHLTFWLLLVLVNLLLAILFGYSRCWFE